MRRMHPRPSAQSRASADEQRCDQEEKMLKRPALWILPNESPYDVVVIEQICGPCYANNELLDQNRVTGFKLCCLHVQTLQPTQFA